MGDLVNFNHNQQDPAQILLAAFYHNLFDLGHTRTNSYLEAKNVHPNEFAVVSVRARNSGHQGGVVGDTYLGREKIVLKGHHNHLHRGVYVGFGRTATCIIMKYRTHNHPEITGGFYYGGAGADIRKAHNMGLRILRRQELPPEEALDQDELEQDGEIDEGDLGEDDDEQELDETEEQILSASDRSQILQQELELHSQFPEFNAYLAFILSHSQVCAAFVELIKVHPALLEPHMKNVIEYMLQRNNDPDDKVSLEACEFWSTYCKAQLPLENIKEFLPLLVPVLLSNMTYDDESLSEAEDDGSFPDQDQDDDVVTNWNLRKCSAAVLHSVSKVFGDEILPMLMPYVQTKLSTSGDETWKEREAAALALGTIADGCINVLSPRLSQIVALLVPLLDDKFPLVRSISCWALSCFIKFIVKNEDDKTAVEYRVWNPPVSKLAAAILSGLTNIWLKPGSRVLYLGDVCGITVLQLSDLVGSDGLVYVRGLSDDIANTVEERSNVIAISAGNDVFLKDYRMVVGMVDVILGDIVYPEKDGCHLQVNYIAANARSYLKTGGHYLISIRPKNDKLTSQVKDPFADHNFLSFDIRMQFKSNDLVMLEPIGSGHAMAVGGFRMIETKKVPSVFEYSGS
ncbi:hypothetical protein POM88_033967 [Heracleum sosnowskyi]|uniref:Uncharacterized protein n=1 Tax=Heracleum sosnowskyi TaxID=360622 RepID=A0AAD8MA47_9APIA|nr:hypothetical protein POM88_033967 [Heracleum sosnowskyi]